MSGLIVVSSVSLNGFSGWKKIILKHRGRGRQVNWLL
jgi:hypothetical protein